VPVPVQPTAGEKAKQLAAKRVQKPAAAGQVLDKNRVPLPAEAARYPKGLVWGALGAAGVLVVAAVIFILTRGGTKAEPELASPSPDNIPQKKQAEKPEKKSVASLVLALKNGPSADRKQALEDLSRLGQQARPALAAMLDALADPDPDLRILAQQALTPMGPPNKNDETIYAAALRVRSPEVRAYAAGQLAQLGQQAKSELVFLRVLLLDDDDLVKDAAQKAVLRIEADLLAGLIQNLQDKSADVRTKAAKELADMGVNAKAALSTLVDLLVDSNPGVRVAVREAFVAIGPDAVVVLEEALHDNNPAVRLKAIDVLGRMGPDARLALPKLITVTFDPDATTKEEALAALGLLGEYAIPYLNQAREREKDPARQQLLVAALDRVGHDKVEPQPTRDSPRDHTGTAGEIQGQLRAWFNATDTNKDGYLDKEELAIKMRGPMAKPYDYTPDGKPPKKFVPSNFPDYAFLCRVDRDNDGRISRDEFERWAYDCAEVMKKDWDERDGILAARQRLTEAAMNQEIDSQGRSLAAQQRLAEQAQSQAMRLQEAAVMQQWANYNNARRAQPYLYQWTWLQQTVIDRRHKEHHQHEKGNPPPKKGNAPPKKGNPPPPKKK